MKTSYNVLLNPLLTEKATMLKEDNNQVLFKVARDANKIDVKRAVEEVFKVKVSKVRMINYRGKKKRMGRYEGKRPDWKKAIVTLQKGEKLDFIEGV